MKTPNPTRPRIRIVLGGVFLMLIVVIATGLFLYQRYDLSINTPASSTEGYLTLDVKAGATLQEVVEQLSQMGMINDLFFARVYLRLNQVNVNLQVGSYQIAQDLTLPEILAEIADGPQIQSVKVTIPEGLRYDEVADILAQKFIAAGLNFDPADFINIVEQPATVSFSSKVADFLNKAKPANANLEGYLFPDTYNIGWDASAQDIVELFVTTLDIKLQNSKIDTDISPRLNSFYEVINLASIVQREARREEDMRNIADIFLKRLENGWPLGADATLLYPYKRWSPGLTQSELETDTPYNTRKRTGLPQTPIANPGIMAISAVLSPITNPYFFFITDKDGIKRYAVTAAQHEANIQQYGLAL